MQKGFTLVELIAVLVLVGILGSSVATSLIPSSSFQLQSSRDQFIAAFFAAQQRAMVRGGSVRLVVSAPNEIDVRADDGGGEASISVGGTQYPISLLSSQTLTPVSFTFNRLGKPVSGAASLTLSQGGESVTLEVSATGHIQ